MARVPNLERLELLEQPPECRDRVEADPGIRVPGGPGELGGLAHLVCQSTLTDSRLSTPIDDTDPTALGLCGVTLIRPTQASLLPQRRDRPR